VCDIRTMPVMIPPALARNVTENWGTDGARWLDALPGLLDEIARDWHLTIGAPYVLSFNWVCAATRADGSPAVLKLGVPAGHLRVEAEALRIYDGHGAVRLLAEDADRGALLLERATPGRMAATLVPARDGCTARRRPAARCRTCVPMARTSERTWPASRVTIRCPAGWSNAPPTSSTSCARAAPGTWSCTATCTTTTCSPPPANPGWRSTRTV
jgi:hypothetical protein